MKLKDALIQLKHDKGLLLGQDYSFQTPESILLLYESTGEEDKFMADSMLDTEVDYDNTGIYDSENKETPLYTYGRKCPKCQEAIEIPDKNKSKPEDYCKTCST